MKLFNLKLGIGIIVVFGLLIAGFALYEPVFFKYYEWRLRSDNPEMRAAAAKAVAGRGEQAMPYIKEWLNSKNDSRVISACLALEKTDEKLMCTVEKELFGLLDGPISDITNAAAKSILESGIDWKKKLHEQPGKLASIYAYCLIFGEQTYFETKCGWFDLDSLPGDKDERRTAAIELGNIRENKAVPQLIQALLNDNSSNVLECAAWSLCRIGDRRAIEPMIEILENCTNDTSGMRLIACSVALAQYKDKRIDEVLTITLKGRNENDGARIALLWRNGGDSSELMSRISLIGRCGLDDFLGCALLRWGDKIGIEMFINNVPWWSRLYYHVDAISRMPENFPEYDFTATPTTRKKQVAAIKEWYKKNKHRLAWDAEKRRYYLK